MPRGAVNPQSREQIISELHAVREESAAYWQSLPTDRFLSSIGEAWSPAENVRHLTKSMRALTVGLRLPRWVLALRFGSAKTPSRSFDTLHDTYHTRLALGASAGRFAPSARRASANTEAQRREIMAQHTQALGAFCDAAAPWPEAALDRRVLPHPLLGRLTVREMLLFTLIHNRHHLTLVQSKLAAR